MDVQWKKMYWLPTPSAWDMAQSWRAKRQAAADQFDSQTSDFMNGVAQAQSNQLTGFVNNTAGLLQTRLSAEAKAKVQALQGSLINLSA